MKRAIKDVWVRSLTEIQPDVLEALENALEKETSPRGKQYLDILIQNAKQAGKLHMVMCQDTGVPTFFVKTPLLFPYHDSIRDAFDEALRELTAGEFPMRPMVVHPITRKDRGDNTALNVPLIHAELDNSIDYMEIKAMPKGAGCGTWSTLQIFPPSVGMEGVKNSSLIPFYVPARTPARPSSSAWASAAHWRKSPVLPQRRPPVPSISATPTRWSRSWRRSFLTP